jgi:two-component system, NtrC family, nitrogen regulation sensor histidine kinase NtrY
VKHFRLQIALRVLLLSFTLFCLAFLVVEGRFWATTWLLAGLGLLQVIDLIRYAEQTHWLLQRFFSSIRFDDFTASIRRSQQGRSLWALTTEMERVMQQFREVRLAKESSYRYLEQVMHHLGVATLSLEDARRVNFLNPAAKRLLQVARISTLDEIDPELAQTVREMRHGEKRSFRLTRGGELLQLVISLTEFKLQGQSYQLVSLQNIRQEMARTEVDAWQKLIRVMTHEIMNSITPVSTLAETTQQLLLGPEPEKARALRELILEDLEDLRDALAIIRSRSEGLINFVSAYRNLTRLPQPEFEPVAVADMLGKFQRLLREHLRQAGVAWWWIANRPTCGSWLTPACWSRC